MAGAYDAAETRFSLGRVFGRGLGVARRHAFGLIGVGLVAGVVAFVAELIVAVIFDIGRSSTVPLLPALLRFLVSAAELGLEGLIFLVPVTFSLAAAAGAMAAELEGRRARFGELFSTALHATPRLYALCVILGVAGGLAGLLFVIPGIMLAAAWVAAIPAQVMERCGVLPSLTRSADLTRGHRWPIVGLGVIVGVANLIGVVVGLIGIGLLAEAADDTSGEVAMWIFLGALPVFIITPIAAFLVDACLLASLYAELRLLKDGGGTVASVFD